MATRSLRVLFLVLCGLTAVGCSTIEIPSANLKEPGWTVRHGQAVWRRTRGGAGIAGEILAATRPDGQAFVQFSKGPFPLVVAQSTAKAWRVEFPPENKHYSRHGLPPQRIIFLFLPRVVSGQPPPRGWSWQRLTQGGWRLENLRSGESLELYWHS